MSDIYVRDTKKAMEEFNTWFEPMIDSMHPEMKKDYERLNSEIEGLIEQYESKSGDIEHLKDKVQELGGDLNE